MPDRYDLLTLAGLAATLLGLWLFAPPLVLAALGCVALVLGTRHRGTGDGEG